MTDQKPRLRAICPEPENFSEAGLAAIRVSAELDARSMPPEELLEVISDYDVLVVRLRTPVTRELLAAAKRLKVILCPTTGLNHLDLDAAAELDLKVIHLKGQSELLRSIPSTAEHTWALLLALARKIPHASAAVRAGMWGQEAFRGRQLHNRVLGILGCGRLGTMVAHYGRAFGMKVTTYDPYAAFVPSYVERYESMGEFLAQSEILSIHVPLNDETRGMIGDAQLVRMPPDSMLVNTSRGEVLDERAVVDALNSGRLAGAAVDVVCNEQSEKRGAGALIRYAETHDNLIITPHIGGATLEAVEITDLHVAGRLAEWVQSKPVSP